MSVEFVSFEEVQQAYFDCRRTKRRKQSQLEYELNYEINNFELYQELNNGTYQIGTSICFCVTHPKLREIFAASFRDRIVHHILMNKCLKFFEADFRDCSYSCRKGKGVYYGVNDVQRQIKEIGNDCWFVKMDMSGFFMSIRKDILWEKVEFLLKLNWDKEVDGEHLDLWLKLFKQVIFHRPETNCIRQGDLTLWDELPPNKSLFHSNGNGLPIGNLTSQILANFYLANFDKWLSDSLQGYGRYVDDFVMLGTNINFIKLMIPLIRIELKKLGIEINEKKTIIQRAYKGLLFTGYVIKPWGLYAGGSLTKRSLAMSRSYERNINRFVRRCNSYLGFLVHEKTYNIRKKIWGNVNSRVRGLYTKAGFKSFHKIKTQKSSN